MNNDKSKSANSLNQIKAKPKNTKIQKVTSQVVNPSVPEIKTRMCCSKDTIKKNDSCSSKTNDHSDSLADCVPNRKWNHIGNNIMKHESFNNELDNKTLIPLTRDEIVAHRKLKVAARKQIKKLERKRMTEKDPVEKPLFSLQLASEDFPTLNSIKTKKRINLLNQEPPAYVEPIYLEKNTCTDGIKNSKDAEKSWKPKVKDPIHIDLSQVLIHKNEKHKQESKKSDPPAQRNILSGNILDSDNPTRKKGKVRPDKVRKPSKIKCHILNERRKKVEIKENSFEVSECSQPGITVDNEIKPSHAVDETCFNTVISSSDLIHSVISVRGKDHLDETQQDVTCSTCPVNIHSRRFREYCTNSLTEELISSVCALLEKVAYFQDRMYAREPIKASAKRRYVAGINQVSKYLQVRKVKLLVIAPDLEKNPGTGGLDERVQYFKMEAESQDIPCVFGPNRKRLGKAVKKNTLVSCVAVLSYEGAEELYTQVLDSLLKAKTKYLRLTGFNETDDTTNVQDLKTEAKEGFSAGDDVTSSLLATLREEIPPADRLLNAIHHCSIWAEE